MTVVGKNIKEKRKSLNITQEELAEKLSVTRQAVSSWENGKTEPDIEMLTKIAQIFDISIDELIYGKTKNILKNIPKKKLIVPIIFIVFAAVSFIAFEIIEPTLKDQVYKYYDYRYYYLMVVFWRPLAIMFGTGGIIYLILNFLKINITNTVIKKLALFIGIFITAFIFVSNIVTIGIIFYTYSHENVSISSYFMSPAFFVMQHQILYTIPAILISLGLSKKHE